MNCAEEDDIWTETNGGGDKSKQGRKKSSAESKSSTKRNSSSSSSTALSVINQEYLSDIKQTFDRFDVKKEGRIEASQLKFAMRSLGFEPKKEEIKRIVDEHQKDGYISSADFSQIMSKRFAEKSVNEEIMKAFQLFDSEHTGKIRFEDLKRISKELGEKISDEELIEMIEEADLDGDKAVNCQEFLRIMKKTSLY